MKKYDWGKRWLPFAATAGTMICLLCGCSQKNVADSPNTEENERTAPGSLEQFADAVEWNDEWELRNTDGDERTFYISADIVLPDTDAMSVVEVEQTVVDGTFKERLLTAFFQNSQVYYHDPQHQTQEELQEKINMWEAVLDDIQGSIDFAVQNGEDPEKAAALHQEYKEELEAKIRDYEELMETASDTYIPAEDFQSCNEYLGYRDGIAHVVTFDGYRESDGTCACVMSFPVHDMEIGPEELQDREECVIYPGDDTGEAEEAGSNRCNLSKEEAWELADRFLDACGFSNQICTSAKDIIWEGYDRNDQGGTENSIYVSYGYAFTYGTGVNKVAFTQFLPAVGFDEMTTENPEDCYGWDNEVSIWVTDAGVVQLSFAYPVTVTRITEKVELLPLETIQAIMENEAIEHPDKYDFRRYRRGESMELIYVRVRDEEKQGVYSYVPAWQLRGMEEDGFYQPITVNAIDGSVIYLDQTM